MHFHRETVKEKKEKKEKEKKEKEEKKKIEEIYFRVRERVGCCEI